jgi:tetratricopeptide (TPR) repeat protein
MRSLLLVAVCLNLSLAIVRADEGAAGKKAAGENAVEAEYAIVQAADVAAQAQAEMWKRANQQKVSQGQGIPEAELRQRIARRFEPVRRAYRQFLDKHPEHAQGHLDYGNLLNEQEDEAGAREQWEKALALAPTNAVLYNNLAGSYSEGGKIGTAFDYFEKAIKLSPQEATYYHNYADTLYVCRKSAMTNYGISEQAVYGKALQAYSNAARLEPRSFSYGWDWAQTFYSLLPLPTETGLAAWSNVLSRATSPELRESVLVHLARVKMLAGRFAEARVELGAVTNSASLTLKSNLLRAIEAREKPAP